MKLLVKQLDAKIRRFYRNANIFGIFKALPM